MTTPGGKTTDVKRRGSCLILGGEGFVGSALSATARRRGWDVTVVGAADYRQHRGATVDLVINANGNASRFKANREPLFDFEASAGSVYRSLFDFRYSQYALISTVDVYSDPATRRATSEEAPINPLALSPYGFHKWLAETFVTRQCRQWWVFRLAQMVGEGLKKGPVYDLLHGRPLWIHQDSRLHFMDTAHVAQVVFELVERGEANQVFNVCGRGNVAIRRVMDLFPGGMREHPRADAQRQSYEIDTDKAAAICGLPDSWEEVRAFVVKRLGERRG